MKPKFNYKKEIDPHVKELLEQDGGNTEANRGQMQEQIRNFAMRLITHSDFHASMIRYGYQEVLKIIS